MRWWRRAHVVSGIKSVLTFGADGDGHLTHTGKWKPAQSEIPWGALPGERGRVSHVFPEAPDIGFVPPHFLCTRVREVTSCPFSTGFAWRGNVVISEVSPALQLPKGAHKIGIL